MDSGFQGQFLNPTVLNKSPLPSNNAKFSSTHGYELPFFQNRSHENDAKFHLPWNKPCDSIILPGTFLCLHSTWTRKISMPGIYGGWTNYWMDSAEEVPLTPLSSALCSGFPSSKVVSLQCLGNAGTQKATSNLPSLCWERENFPVFIYKATTVAPVICDQVNKAPVTLSVQNLPLCSSFPDCIANLKHKLDHFLPHLRPLVVPITFGQNEINSLNPNWSQLDSW